MKNTSAKIKLGTGLLSWPNSERIVDRYGLVALFHRSEVFVPYETDPHSLDGAHGHLLAVLDGEEITLGIGTLFTDHQYGGVYVGLKPDDGREDNWLDSTALYTVDMYIIRTPVDLYFVESEAQAS